MPFHIADVMLQRQLDRLLADVRRKAGLRCDEAVVHKLSRVLAQMTSADLENWVSGLERVSDDHPDWLNLIEALTVHETYFFRDNDHHTHLRRRIFPALIASRQQHRHLILWSAGCATGEEAYSLAILALEALVDQGEAIRKPDGIDTPWRIEVVGSDISRPALHRARNAVYDTGPMGSFRDLPGHYRHWFCPVKNPTDRMGSQQGGGTGTGNPGEAEALLRVHDDVRRYVRFVRCNLLRGDLPLERADLISCRNVLIYFEDQARSEVQRRLISVLADDGWLVLGSTDRPYDPGRFERWPGQKAIAYRQRLVVVDKQHPVVADRQLPVVVDRQHPARRDP